VTAARRALRVLGAPVRWLLLGLIRLYQLTLSGWLGGQCRFYPTCSHYAEEAIRVHGAARGSLMAAWRIARCGPFTAGGVDHVPPGRDSEYDTVIQREASS
jgi:uncharacterized protein